MRRRELLKLASLSLAAACAREKKTVMSAQKMPVLFQAHGSPQLLDDAGWVAELAAWAKALPRPKAVLTLSAHWDEKPVAIGATSPVPLIYDFYGFPKSYYEVKYPAPGAPGVAARVRELLGAAKVPFVDEPRRGLDHGAYVPLVAMYPQADVPVLQLSLPGMDPHANFALGRALAPLRDEGVLLTGSGFLTHNMRAFSDATPQWASEFDQWAKQTLERRDIDALLDYQRQGPGVQLALPTVEHFVPVIVAAGAVADQASVPVSFPITGFVFGSFTRRSVQFG